MNIKWKVKIMSLRWRLKIDSFLYSIQPAQFLGMKMKSSNHEQKMEGKEYIIEIALKY